MGTCYSCYKEIDIIGTVSRLESCPKCGADLHCCLNCKFYDQTAYNECHEPQADRVLDKQKSNFCDYFSLKENIKKIDKKEKNPLEELEQLFKKK